MKFELDYIEKLIKLMTDSPLSELSLDDGEKAISLKKEQNTAVSQPAKPKSGTTEQEVLAEIEADMEKIEAQPEKKSADGTPILSPMVGTFYSAPSKDASPFVQVGDIVSKGQVVCIIEAMKLMNEIEAEVSGKVSKILVENGQPVEYGQVLMYVE